MYCEPICELSLLGPTPWTFTKDQHSVRPPACQDIKTLHCHAAATASQRNPPRNEDFCGGGGRSGLQTASLLSLASHRGFVRQAFLWARSLQETPLCSRTQRGRKSRSVFRQSCGHTGIIHSSVALRIFCIFCCCCKSRKETGGPQRKRLREDILIIGSSITLPNPHRRIASFLPRLPLFFFFFSSPLWLVKSTVPRAPAAKVTNPSTWLIVERLKEYSQVMSGCASNCPLCFCRVLQIKQSPQEHLFTRLVCVCVCVCFLSIFFGFDCWSSRKKTYVWTEVRGGFILNISQNLSTV